MTAAVGVLFLMVTAAVGFGVGSEFVSIALADVAALVAALIGTGAALQARRRAVGRHGWTALAIAMGLWALGEALWTTWEVVLSNAVPYPSIADVAFLAGVPFAVAGLLRFVPAHASRFGARSLIDGCVIAASTLFVGWSLALGPAVRVDDEPFLSHAVSVAYPVTDIMLAVLAVVVLQWGASRSRTSLQLVAVGFLLMAAADTVFIWLISHDTYTGDGLVSMLWPAGYLAVALAARSEARASAKSPVSSPSVLSLLLPFIPLAVAGGVAISTVLGGDDLGPFLTAVGVVLFSLVIVRQTVTAWELRSTVVALHEREAELARLALTDSLTGLANRARFTERLERAVADHGTRPAVVYVDLDGFKAVNDRFGHAVGDQLLVAAADRLTAAATATMLVSRVGGDEFVILIEGGHGEAVGYAQRILDGFKAPFLSEGEVIRFQASVGVAVVPAEGGALEAVRRADAAMYVAKANGKGRAVDYPDDDIVAWSSAEPEPATFGEPSPDGALVR